MPHTAMVTLGLEILARASGPMTLVHFAREFYRRWEGKDSTPSAEFSEALREAILAMDHPRLRIKGPQMPGVGYVYDAANPDSYPAVLDETRVLLAGDRAGVG